MIFGFNSTIIPGAFDWTHPTLPSFSYHWVEYFMNPSSVSFISLEGIHLFTILFWLPYRNSFQLGRFPPPQGMFCHVWTQVWMSQWWQQGLRRVLCIGILDIARELFIIRYYLTHLWRLRSPTICHLQTADLESWCCTLTVPIPLWAWRPENQEWASQAGEDGCPSSISQAESRGIPPPLPCCSAQALKGLDKAHPHWE